MALLDRFRGLPANRHADPEVRLAYIEALSIDERAQLASAAREDESARVRRAAVAKLMDPAALGAVARDDADAGVRAAATSMLRDIALEAFEETGEAESLAAVEALSDPKIISQIAKTATRESVAKQALARIADSRVLGSIARHAALESVRLAAFQKLSEHDEIVAVAMNGEFKDTAVAAVERLTSRSELEQVATRSSNRNAAKRARGRLRELDERAAIAAAAVAPTPDADEQQARSEAAAANLRARLEEARALEAERRRVEAEMARQREDRIAAEQAAAQAAAEEKARKDAERRRARALELVEEAQAAAGDSDLLAGRRRIALGQHEWKDLTAFQAADGDLAARYAAADARLTAREAEAKDAEARARHEARHALHRLLDRVEPLATNDEVTSKVFERALRVVRAALAGIPPLPSRHDHEEIVGRLKAVQGALAPKLQDLRAMEGWQRWANVGIQEALCEKMEALNLHDDPEEIARRVRELQQQWRQAADVPRAQGEALWRRFKAAHDEVWPRCAAHFAAEAAVRADNLAKRAALCAQVEALSESTDWIRTADAIKRLQAEWKTIGPVSRGQEKLVWERFRAACDRFFKRRHDDLVRRKVMWAENLAKKDALCVTVEALAGSTEWDAAASEIKRLQAEWKAIGPVKKTRSDAIWQRFRGACDAFFLRYAQRHETARDERVAARAAVCAELEALASPAASLSIDAAAAPQAESDSAQAVAPADLVATVRALRSRWQHELSLRGVDPERAAALDQRFTSAFYKVIARWPGPFSGTDLDPDANRQRMEALVRRVEGLASSLGGPPSAGGDEALTPASRLAAMLKEALAANTIGGKVNEESRWRAAEEDVRQAQADWSRIGPVPQPTRQALTDRFQRACRRVLERAGGAGKAEGAGRTGQIGGAGRPG